MNEKGVTIAKSEYDKATENLYKATKDFIDAGFRNRKTANTIGKDFRDVMYYFANECCRMEEVYKK